ncbi:MAG: HAMP domain-containing histidine kinase [Verrucomicrobiota bacterium]|jgi:signal transduction histidine kinase|nr:HAMP domain-containing histidine kinase [Verrucomicrobiota bacterium]
MDAFRQNRHSTWFSFAWTAGAWVVLVALLSAGGLFFLRGWHDRAAHQAATQTVVERGQWLAMSLALRAASAVEANAASDAGSWKEFSGLIESLREVEPELEFVSIQCDGVTLFREHAGDPGAEIENHHFEGPVRIGRRVLTVDGLSIPVVTFSVTVANGENEPVVLEMGMQRQAVEREESPTTTAIESMYRLTFATVAVCFGMCLALVAWMARREEKRARRRRREEHLAFSGMLANGIVHDFRNPMSSLRLDAQMLEKEVAKGPEARTERLAHLSGRMMHTLDRMDQVFKEFLTLAKPDEEGVEMLDLGVCLRECAEMVAPRFEAAGLSLNLSRVDQEATVVRAAPASVKRAILNILINAQQHAGKDGRVMATVFRQGGEVCLRVCDTGPGIPASEREKVFDMFYTTRPKGTGLGLFLARTAVEKNGGWLQAMEPPEGKGACLQMTFPAQDKEEA